MPPIKKLKLSDSVVEEVLKAIENGRFKPGQKIPSEKILTKEFGISRTTLREAFQKLELLGKMSIRQGDGTYLTEDAPANLFSNINTAFVFGNIEMTQYLDARECLELYATSLAIDRATADDLESMQEIICLQEKNLHNNDEFAKCDFKFHQTLVQLSKNSILAQFWVLINASVRAEQARVAVVAGIKEQALKDHKRLVKMIANKDHKRAQATIREHLSRIPGIVLSELSNMVTLPDRTS